MFYDGLRNKYCGITPQAKAEAEIDILHVTKKILIEAPDFKKGTPPVKRDGRTRAEDFAFEHVKVECSKNWPSSRRLDLLTLLTRGWWAELDSNQ